MADDRQPEIEERLWSELEAAKAGMLAIEDAGQHAQPMHAYVDQGSRTLWFITSRKTDLVDAVGQGATAIFTITSGAQDFYASMRGPITQSTDDDKLKEIWNFVAAAWFEGGPDSREVTLLEMPIGDALIWISQDGGVAFGLEVLKANILGGTPDVGLRTHLDFRTGA